MKNNIKTTNESLNGFVDAARAAQFLGISKNFLYKLTCSNRVPFYRLAGKHVCFDLSELNQMVREHRVPTDAELQEKGGRND